MPWRGDGRGLTSGAATGVILGAVLLLQVLGGPARAGSEVDLQLVLAVDASASIDEREFRLQMSGIAAAFRDAAVIDAIGSGPLGRIGIVLVVWADTSAPRDVSPWRLLDSAESAARFARMVEDFPRRVEGGTGIGRAVVFAIAQIEGNGLSSRRKVIDVSGDGRETAFRDWSIPPYQARAMAIARDITVNGLAILSEYPALATYYEEEVAGGFGSFVMTANGIKDYALAIRRKLIREIEYRPIVSRLPAAAE